MWEQNSQKQEWKEMFNFLSRWLSGRTLLKYYFLGLVLGVIGILIIRFWIFGLASLFLGCGLIAVGLYFGHLSSKSGEANTHRTTIQDSSSQGDRHINLASGNYNEFVQRYVQGDDIDNHYNYSILDNELAAAVHEIEEVLAHLLEQGYNTRDAVSRISRDLASQAHDASDLKNSLFRWKALLDQIPTQSDEFEMARAVIEFAASSEAMLGEPTSAIPEGYERLRDLLKANQWQEADEETESIIASLCGKEALNFDNRTVFGSYISDNLTADDIVNISRKNLSIIDNLWVVYSGGRFGFSVQKQIFEYVEENDFAYNLLPENDDMDDEALEAFGEAVGWYVNNRWIYRADINYSSRAKVGHLPAKVMLSHSSQLPNRFSLDKDIFRIFITRQYNS
ncbi:GUN4 domain-containing protein [Microcoleus sp. FACHB-1515]|uniref:GUN4 domain-containing protein n=1 Tax=Cyanophyceae TaxID=3028117 RepID=UPI001686F1DD|nr:GUN4 domain-containing protein [Microcoleus sp. FACHB-1515]MBD2092556.1 GUN4 domain-containing protein [Microcoleus sp. FACHB-1515]